MKRIENNNVEQKIRSLLVDYEPEFKEEYWEKMQQKLDSSIPQKGKVRMMTYFKYAASILILISISIYLYNTKPAEIISKTSNNEKTEINLADGSTAWLNRSTKFVYTDKFENDIRNVFLEGEAYFEVTADTLRPFIVNTPHAEITVLGTKFNIRANTAEDVEVVSVVEGKVLVVSKSNNHKVILEKGEKSILDIRNASLKKEPINDLNFLSWQTNKIQFINDSLDYVVKALSKHYNRDIILMNEGLKKTKLTSTMRDQTLEQVLEVITLTLNVEVETRNDSIFLKID